VCKGLFNSKSPVPVKKKIGTLSGVKIWYGSMAWFHAVTLQNGLGNEEAPAELFGGNGSWAGRIGHRLNRRIPEVDSRRQQP
jgi:hypothetical protein